jgi:predicted DNA-binding transcriptional regulator AlpA
MNRADVLASASRSQLPEGCTPALNTAQASAYTGLAEKTLEGLRCRGGGPRAIRYGRKAVRYLVRDLDTWMEARAAFSTSEEAAA